MSKPPANPVDVEKKRALTLLQQGQLKKAKPLFEKLCQANRTDAESLYILGSINGQLGNLRQAASYFSQVVALHPDSFQAHCGLGAACEHLGQADKASDAFRHALRLQPTNADIMVKLAGILLSQGNLTECEKHLQQALQLKPGFPGALHMLGEIRCSENRLAEGIQFFKQAINTDPNLTGTCNRLGRALHMMGNPSQAITHYRHALSINPSFAEAHNNLANALVAVGKMQEARDAFRNAQQARPNYIDAIAGEAALDEREGDYEAAYGRLSPLILRNIKHPAIATVFANLCPQLERCTEAIDYAEGLLKDTLTVGAQKEVHFTLGKLYDSFGSYDMAFGHYRKANEKEPGSHNPNEHAANIDALINTFDWNFLSTAPRAKCRSARPVFIVGMPRSGTTLTEQILASHPDVFGAGELTDIMDQPKQLSKMIGPEPGYPYFLRKLTTEILDQLATSYLDHLEEMEPVAARVIDKMPLNFMHLGLIALEFPDTRIIHCVRDPRDTCLSMYFQHFSATHAQAKNLEHLGLYYRQYLRVMQHWKNLLDLPLLEVRYEDLVTEQEQISRQLVDFIGLKWDERCLHYHQNGRTVETFSYYQVRQPIYSSSMGRWKNYQPYIAPLVQALGDALDGWPQ